MKMQKNVLFHLIWKSLSKSKRFCGEAISEKVCCHFWLLTFQNVWHFFRLFSTLSLRYSTKKFHTNLSFCLFVRPSVCSSVYPSVCLCVYLSPRLLIHLSVCLCSSSVYQSVWLSVYLSPRLFICLLICLSVSSSVYLSPCLFFHRSVCLSICICVSLSICKANRQIE